MLKNLSDEKLSSRLEKLVRHERKVMALVLEHIAEVERRKLYLVLGYDGLFSYLTKALEYSESAAYRRMQAARALLLVPEIKPRLEDGSLKLSQVCLVQKTLRQEEKVSSVSLQKRKNIFAAVVGKTGIETEKILDAKVTVAAAAKACVEKHRRDDSVEVNLRVSKELYAKLQKVKELYSHIDPGADWVKVLDLMADDVIKKRDPLAKKPSTRSLSGKQETTPYRRQPIPMEVRRFVLKRDNGKCQYVSPQGRKCESRHQIEVDHIRSVCEGGGNEPENLRILCRQHNAVRVRRKRASTPLDAGFVAS